MKESRVELPEDLAMEILCKLPVKSLIRFGSVSKYWCSCFRNPRFISKHHQNNLENNHLNLLIEHRSKPYYFYQLSTQKEDESFRVQHDIRSPFADVHGPDCHGLFCLYDAKQSRASLWNPSTREIKILPPSPSSLDPLPGHILSTTFGFGFDSKTNDCKVIQVITLNSDCLFRVELYSLKSDTWKVISPPSCNCFLFTPTHVDGICYWEALAIADPYEIFLLSFDIVEEKFSTLPYPEPTRSRHTSSTLLLEFNGSLRLIAYNASRQGTSKVIDFWTMNGGGIWSKESSIVESDVPGFQFPLGLWKNGELLFSVGTDDNLYLFDPSTRKVKKLGINVCPYNKKLTTYVESLFLIDGRRRSEREEDIKRQPPRDPSNRREKKRRFRF